MKTEVENKDIKQERIDETKEKLHCVAFISSFLLCDRRL